MKHLNLTLIALLLSLISFAQAPGPITGSSAICIGGLDSLTDGITGGVWSSSITSVATVDPASGIVTGIATGTVDVSYTTGGGSVFIIITVTPGVDSVAGPTSVCEGSTTSLMDATTGGVWSSNSTFIATVDSVAGTVFAEGGGSATISYTLANGCTSTTLFTVAPVPYTGYVLSGGGIACSGTAGVGIYLLYGSTPGVTYDLFDDGVPVGVAIAGTGSPLTLGSFSAPGTYTVVATNTTTGCTSVMPGSATISDSLSPTVYTISATGGGSYCSNAAAPSITLAASDPGVSYQLYDGAAAVGAPMTGTGSSLDFGVTGTSGTYTIIAIDPADACTTTMSGSAVITENPIPPRFPMGTGGGYCRGTSGLPVTLLGSSAGISYQLYDNHIADGAPLLGTGAAITFGIDTSGVYTVIATNLATGCTDTMTGSETISSTLLTPSVGISIAPSGVLCNGSTAGFVALPFNGGATPTYTWTVNGAFAGTGSSYIYVPTNGDAVSVLMRSSLPCASPDSAITADSLTVDVPVITVSSSDTCGGVVQLVANGGVSYTWAPASGLACVTCDTITLNPNTTVVYTLTATDIYGCTGSTTITADGNRIAGHISGITTFGAIRVWLIQFNTTDSSMVTIDSVMTCTDDGTPYYEFDNAPAGSYVVKAEVLGGVPGASGYITTYGLSNPHWVGSSGIVHGAGTDTMHITMLSSIIYPGPCSISGLIYASAGSVMSSPTPVSGLLVYLQDAHSGDVLTYTYTNSAGLYTFSHITYGHYVTYPELYDYYTMPAYVITLNSTDTVAGNIDFWQFNSLRVITPYIINVGVKPLSSEGGLSVYPNPASSNLNIKWTNQPTGSANVVITDVVGREVYRSVININAASRVTLIPLTGIKSGMYIVNIQSTDINYTGKLMIEQ